MLLKEINEYFRWKPYLVFTIFTFFLYSNTLTHYFALDDGIVMIDNAFTQKGIEGIPYIFKYDPFVGNIMNNINHNSAEYVQKELKIVTGGRYRPLSLVTFALEIEFFGKEYTYPNSKYKFKANAFVSHFTNILLYLLTICLLFRILHRIFPYEKDKKWYFSFPFLVSLLFLVHPIHTEVVANIKGRDDILTLFCSLATLWFTIKYFDTNKNFNLFFSGLCFFLALLSKENAITFLAVIPLTVYYFISNKKGRIIISMLPLIIFSGLFMLIRSSALGFTNTSEIISDLLNNPFMNATKEETLATIFYTLLLYVKLLFFPHPLTYDYYPFHIEIVDWSNSLVIVSVLLYSGMIIYAIYGLLKKRDILSYSIWFYLLPLTIVSNLFFPIGTFMGERFIYISSIGFSLIVGWLIYNYLISSRSSIRYLALIMALILCLFSVKTISRNKAWKNSFTLFETDIKTSKNSAKGNYLWGHVLLRKATFPDNEIEVKNRKKYCDKAAQYLNRAIQIYPNHTDALEQLGNLYFDCYKDVAKSLHYYSRASRSTTKETDVFRNYVLIVLEQINYLLSENKTVSTPSEIIQSCDELLEVMPNFGEVYYIKGLLYGKYLNNIELSLYCFEKAETIDFPKTTSFYEDMGVVFAVSTNYQKALHYLLKAIELGTENYVTYINIGVIYEQLGDKYKSNLYLKKGEGLKSSEKEIENFIE